MNSRQAHHAPYQPHAHAVGARALARAPGTMFEWEELPSLATTLQRGDALAQHGSAKPVWHATAPMPLATERRPAEPRPFREPLNGLHVREIECETVFDHFFGD